ncbi:MAG: cytochrome c biogenesis protein CcdA [Patescibacteria group bacterium]
MDYPLIIPVFIAGVLTFLAPCTLPLVPAYLGFISGVSLGELQDPTRARLVRGKIFLNGLAFVIGWTAVFVILGTLVGFIGSALVPYRQWLARIGGIFVIVFGLFMLNIMKIPFLARERALAVPTIFERGKPVNSLVLGAAFGLGWTPCVGPILGSILLLASTTTTALKGAVLLSVFSLGLAVPFLAIAAGIGQASQFIERRTRYLHVVSVIGGILLIFLGILLLTDRMDLLIYYGYRFFRFIEYERLLDYL